MQINNKQITLNDAKLAMEKRFIAVNNKTLNDAELITPNNINALNLGPLTYLVPKGVDILTAPTMFDRFVGANAAVKEGYFGQDTVTIRFNEKTGVVQPYVVGSTVSPGFNFADVNYTGISVGVAYREIGWKADYKEIASAGMMNFDIISDKVNAALNALTIDRNRINFLGLAETNGSLPVYGLLNFPNLTNYIALPNGNWANSTPQDMFNDINFMINTLAKQSSGLSHDGFSTGASYRIGVAMDAYGYLSRINEYGLMLTETISKAYGGKVEIFGIPEMNGYDSGKDIAIIMIDYGDGVPTAKGSYIELARFFDIFQHGHSMDQVIVSALTGCIVNRPMLVARFNNITSA